MTGNDKPRVTARRSNDATMSAETAGIREWAGLALLALPTILLGLDLTVLHLALPALALDLRPTSLQALWIVDAYGFMVAGFLITMGSLGDRIGRRKLLLIGSAAFCIASVIAAFSTSAAMLIAARALLGVAGATLMPSTLALISNMFRQARQRALAIGIWATMFALGMAMGPMIGGILVAHFWWGAAFLLAVPVAGILLALAPVLLPEYRAPAAGRLDMCSVALSLLALLPIIYGIKQFAKQGWGIEAALPFFIGSAFTVLFVRRQQRLDNPLIDMELFSNKAFSAALLILLMGLVCVGGTMLLVSQYLQLVIGHSPIRAGLWMGLPALAMLVAGVAAPLLARNIRPGHVISGALALSVIGYLMLAQLDNGANGTMLVATSFSLVYLGLGAIAALGTDLVVGAAPMEKAGAASAMSETVQELGLALGIAILGSLATAIYRIRMNEQLHVLQPRDAQNAITDSLAAATSVAQKLPAGLLESAQAAFMAGFTSAAKANAVSIGILAAIAAVTLRHVDIRDETSSENEKETLCKDAGDADCSAHY